MKRRSSHAIKTACYANVERKGTKNSCQKTKKDPNPLRNTRIFRPDNMNAEILDANRFKYSHSIRQRVYYITNVAGEESTEIANYLAQFFGCGPAAENDASIYFKIYGELHPKFSEWMDCGLHIYGKMCGYF